MSRSDNSPKYEKLALALDRQIRSGALRPGAALPSQRALMAEFQVSLATVRRCLDILENRGLLARHPGKGVYVSDQVSPATGQDDGRLLTAVGRQGSGTGSGELRWLNLGVFCKDWRPGRAFIWWERILRGAERAVHAGGGQIRLIEVSQADESHPEALLQRCLAEGTNAVLNMGDHWLGASLERASQVLQQRRVPSLLVYSSAAWPMPMSSLVIDGRRGMQLMVEYLVSLGHRKLIFLGMERGYAWAQERIQAFSSALAGTELRGALILGKFPGEAAHGELLAQLVRGGYTGVVCVNDDFAAWATACLREQGLRVPAEVSITGFDDDYLYRQLELTTLGYPLEELGVIAIGTLARQFYDATFDRVGQTRLAPLLVRRSSTAPPRERLGG